MAQERRNSKELQKLVEMNKFVYDAVLWILSILVDLFFREIHPRGSWKVPRKGPVLFVAAPHANQFVDPLILSRVVRLESQRRIAFLIAEKSTKRKFVGTMSRLMGAVPVGRAMDSKHPATGKIYLPDPVNDPTLIRGVGTNFESKDFQIGGLLVLPPVNNESASSDIVEIIGPEELRVKKPFKGQAAIKQLTGREDISESGKILDANVNTGSAQDFEGTKFQVAPKVDQTVVYDAVFEKLNQGGCVGIFPEGGSHDRTELLPLKAGVAIMALGAVAANPNCNVKIVPVGMNYFHAHKFRSRAVVEFGDAIEVPPDLIDLYKKGERRDAVGHLLQNVFDGLLTVTVTAPDYDTLMLIQAVRRLYNIKGKRLPLPMVVELNRRLVKGYERYKDDERVVKLKKAVISYNKELLALNIRDHQVEVAKFSYVKAIGILFYRLGKLVLLSVAVLPGLLLFAPVFIAGKVISIKKSKEALAASTVKIKARDVVATWKLLVSMALTPALLLFYMIIGTWWSYKNRVHGYVPDWMPLPLVPVTALFLLPSICYASLRFGEIGMDIVKSLRPILISLSPTSGNALVKLRERRRALQAEVTELINTLGPEMFPDFDAARIVSNPFQYEATISQRHHRRTDSERSALTGESMISAPPSPEQERSTRARRSSSIAEGLPPGQSHLPRNESFKDLGNIGLFASRPHTPKSRSRPSSSGGLAGSSGFPLQGFSTLNSKEGFEEVSKKIRGAMWERGQRRSSGAGMEWEVGSDGTTTPGSEYGRKDK